MNNIKARAYWQIFYIFNKLVWTCGAAWAYAPSEWALVRHDQCVGLSEPNDGVDDWRDKPSPIKSVTFTSASLAEDTAGDK